MLLIIPVWTVLVNFFGTVKGKWEGFGRNLPA
jgi:cytochrome c oxidase cbb3-type subunit 1